MRNIKKFETFEDFLASQESVSGSGKYVEDILPGFVFVKERYEDGTYAFYNGEESEESEEYEFGDIVYYDETPKLKKVYYSAFTPSMGEKVGLVVVPTALSPDGNARIMAFGSITEVPAVEEPAEEPGYAVAKPESKDIVLGESAYYSKAAAKWYSKMADENQTVYTCVPGFYLDGGEEPKEQPVLNASAPGSEGQTSYYEIPVNLRPYNDNMSRFSSDANFMYPNPHTNGEYYNTANTIVAISPFLGDSLKEQDPAYLQEELAGGSIGPITPTPVTPVLGASDSLGGGNYNAFSDFSGYTWTYGCPPEYNGGSVQVAAASNPSLKSSKPISGLLGAYFPHDYVRQFYTDGTQQGDWYLPSMGEMGFVVARYKKIFEIFQYLFSVGAFHPDDGTDNIPGMGGNSQFSIWTSTIAANMGGGIQETTLASSIPGADTFPTVCPVYVNISAVTKTTESSGGNSPLRSSNPELLGASNDDSPTFDMQFVLSNGTLKGGYEVLPFAMINKGEIKRTIGDYTVENGHQMKDYKSSSSGGGIK